MFFKRRSNKPSKNQDEDPFSNERLKEDNLLGRIINHRLIRTPIEKIRSTRFSKFISINLTSKDIRNKLLLTLLVVVIYRGLASIPLPGVDMSVYKQYFGQSTASEGSFLFSIFTGGQFETPSVVGLGIAAYINASIIMQLLPYAIPRLKELQKEGERGRQLINQITRYLTLPLSFFYSVAYLLYLSQRDLLNPNADPTIASDPSHVPVYLIPHSTGMDWPTIQKILFMAVILAAGTMFLMWLSELVTENGLGNGSSVVITVGILAMLPTLLVQDFSKINFGTSLSQLLQGNLNALTNPLILSLVGVIIGFIVVVGAIIFINESQRNVDIQYARRVRGAEIGQGSSLPIKFTLTGVLPVIFATSLLSIPQIIVPVLLNVLKDHQRVIDFLTSVQNGFLYAARDNVVDNRDITYIIVYFLLVIIFGIFYSFIVLNPKETAENLQKSGAFIPGVRPGRATEKFITGVLVRISLVGSILLAIIALIPLVSRDVILITTGNQLAILSGIGGTSILIIVTVLLDTLRQYRSLRATKSYEKYIF